MTKTVSAMAASPASLFSEKAGLADELIEAFLAVRNETERRAAPLSPEDQLIQSMPDASPAKWHRAHTTWFFEQFLLGEHSKGYVPYHPDYAFLFNSYYVSAGPRHARHRRGDLTRPSAEEITAYRRHVDAAVVKFFREAGDDQLSRDRAAGRGRPQPRAAASGIDVDRHPARLCPEPDPARLRSIMALPGRKRFGRGLGHLNEGIHSIGHAGDSFHFDNEKPVHRALVGPVRLSRNLVTNAEWIAFMADGGYTTPTLWLMDGFAAASAEAWQAPGHWREIDGKWHIMTLAGLKPVDPEEARSATSAITRPTLLRAGAASICRPKWNGKSPPAPAISTTPSASSGNGRAAPIRPTPAIAPIEGALGEYNGKFMVNQLVLRGSSLATPDGHSRVTYRNFFYPHHRWQFTGLRLADYARLAFRNFNRAGKSASGRLS